MAEQDNVAPQEPAAPKPPWEEKPVPPEPRDAREHAQVREIAASLPDAVLAAKEFAGQVTVTSPRERDRGRVPRLQGEARLQVPGGPHGRRLAGAPEPRFDVVYWTALVLGYKRLRLKVRVADGDEVPSVTGVWLVANWMEREAFDMFGICFAGHPNLRRILTWEGFNGHPLRKDFPIEGIDTGAAIYPDVYPPGGGPVAGGEGE